MRILLAQNSLYYPAHGGGDKSNRLLMEALAARGHECRVVARTVVFGDAEHRHYLASLASRGVAPLSTAEGVVVFERAGVEVHIATARNPRAYFAAQAEIFAPDIILASTDDPAQLLLEAALRYGKARVVYLARATLAVPFGPDCAFPNEAKTTRLRACDAIVGVSRYVADYVRRYAGVDAVHVPISLMEPEESEAWPDLGRYANEFVTLVNPCAVKGIAIFLELADAFPHVAFAAVPTWGTNRDDRAALLERPNVRLLDPVDDINVLLARTRVLLVPSLWAEARSRIVLEAMLRSVPVIAADVGGISEAKMGVPYLLPVNAITRYETRVDEQMVPVAEVPPQELGPWRSALKRLLEDPSHYREIALASRQAALAYAADLHVGHFESLLQQVLSLARKPFAAPTVHSAAPRLSEDKRKLLALRLRKKAASSAWFPTASAAQGRRLFTFPHAGGGTGNPIPNFAEHHTVPVRLPGREARVAEAPFTRMAPLIDALAAAIHPYLHRPFAFFGHSMGAAVAFELARELRRRGLPLPVALIASAARAPNLRRNHVPPAAPAQEQFVDELRRLQGIPADILEDPAVLRVILPALEADADLYRNYIYTGDAPLPFPIRAYGGADDPNVRQPHLEAWAAETTASFAVRIFSGGHFYLYDGGHTFSHGSEFLAALAEDLC